VFEKGRGLAAALSQLIKKVQMQNAWATPQQQCRYGTARAAAEHINTLRPHRRIQLVEVWAGGQLWRQRVDDKRMSGL